jgi:hypothetical protein
VRSAMGSSLTEAGSNTHTHCGGHNARGRWTRLVGSSDSITALGPQMGPQPHWTTASCEHVGPPGHHKTPTSQQGTWPPSPALLSAFLPTYLPAMGGAGTSALHHQSPCSTYSREQDDAGGYSTPRQQRAAHGMDTYPGKATQPNTKAPNTLTTCPSTVPRCGVFGTGVIPLPTLWAHSRRAAAGPGAK